MGSSAITVAPFPGWDSTLQRSAQPLHAFLHSEHVPVRASAPDRSPRPSSVTRTTMLPAVCSHRDLRVPGAGVAHRVVQRFLHQPVDADLVLVRQVFRTRFSDSTATSISLRRDTSRPCHSSAATRPRSSSIEGRSSSAILRTACKVSFGDGLHMVELLPALRRSRPESMAEGVRYPPAARPATVRPRRAARARWSAVRFPARPPGAPRAAAIRVGFGPAPR